MKRPNFPWCWRSTVEYDAQTQLTCHFFSSSVASGEYRSGERIASMCSYLSTLDYGEVEDLIVSRSVRQWDLLGVFSLGLHTRFYGMWLEGLYVARQLTISGVILRLKISSEMMISMGESHYKRFWKDEASALGRLIGGPAYQRHDIRHWKHLSMPSSETSC